MKTLPAISVVVAFGLYGCANGLGGHPASYAPPLPVHTFSCDQIAAELGRLYLRVNQLGGRMDEAAINDKWLATGKTLFWPSLLILGGTKQQEEEYSRLKGDYDVLEREGAGKQCGLATRSVNPISAAQMQPEIQRTNTYPSYTLLPSGAVVPDSPSVITVSQMIPVKTVSGAAISKKTRGDVCDTYVARGEYCWWSPPGNYSMCPPIATFNECKAWYGGGCQLGHGKVLPMC